MAVTTLNDAEFLSYKTLADGSCAQKVCVVDDTSAEKIDTEIQLLCDTGNSDTKFYSVVQYKDDGTLEVVAPLALDGSAYTVVGPVEICALEDAKLLLVEACDELANGDLVRFYYLQTHQAGALISSVAVNADGSAYTVINEVQEKKPVEKNKLTPVCEFEYTQPGGAAAPIAFDPSVVDGNTSFSFALGKVTATVEITNNNANFTAPSSSELFWSTASGDTSTFTITFDQTVDFAFGIWQINGNGERVNNFSTPVTNVSTAGSHNWNGSRLIQSSNNPTATSYFTVSGITTLSFNHVNVSGANWFVGLRDFVVTVAEECSGRGVKYIDCDNVSSYKDKFTDNPILIDWIDKEIEEELTPKYQTDDKVYEYKADADVQRIVGTSTEDYDQDITSLDICSFSSCYSTVPFNLPSGITDLAVIQQLLLEAFEAAGFTITYIELYSFPFNSGDTLDLVIRGTDSTGNELASAGNLPIDSLGFTHTGGFYTFFSSSNAIINLEDILTKKASKYYLCDENGLPDASTIVYLDCDSKEQVTGPFSELAEDPELEKYQTDGKEYCYPTQKEVLIQRPTGTLLTSTGNDPVRVDICSLSSCWPTQPISLTNGETDLSVIEAALLAAFTSAGFNIEYFELVSFGWNVGDPFEYIIGGTTPEGSDIGEYDAIDALNFVDAASGASTYFATSANTDTFFVDTEGKACKWFVCGEDGKPDSNTIEWRNSKTLEVLNLFPEDISECVDPKPEPETPKYQTDGKELCYNFESQVERVRVVHTANGTFGDSLEPIVSITYGGVAYPVSPAINQSGPTNPIIVALFKDILESTGFVFEAFDVEVFDPVNDEEIVFIMQGLDPSGDRITVSTVFDLFDDVSDINGNKYFFGDGVTSLASNETLTEEKKACKFYLCDSSGRPDPSTIEWKDSITLEDVDASSVRECRDEPEEKVALTPRFEYLTAGGNWSPSATTTSVTLKVVETGVTVDDGTSGPFPMDAGCVLSWGVEDNHNFLNSNLTFDALTGSAIVIWTEE